jgi:hypothetical protein
MAKRVSSGPLKGGATHAILTRRERQIVDILYRRGRATAGEVMEELPGDPSYSTVRTTACRSRCASTSPSTSVHSNNSRDGLKTVPYTARM